MKDIQSLSKTTKKKTYWTELLDDYPKMTDKTPIKERVCVVNPKISDDYRKCEDYWRWRPPYWVFLYNDDEFLLHMVIVGETGMYEPKKSCGVDSFTAKWHTIKYLESNDFVQLSRNVYHGQSWCKRDNAISFISSNFDGEQYAKKSDASAFPMCPILKKRVYQTEMCHYITQEGEEKVASVIGVQKLGHYEKCGDCSKYHHDSLLYQYEDVPKLICQSCKNKRMEQSVIRHYNDSNFLPPMPDEIKVVQHGKKMKITNRRMFGVEVELGFNVGDRVENAINVWETIGKDFCYIKHDGSITNQEYIKAPKMGFEVVSAPAGINVHRERWGAIEKCKNYKTFRAWDTGSCGFHVHISRDALTTLQIGRILVFVNHKNNRYFMEVVAGRSQNNYTAYIDKSISDCEKKDDNKYLAVRTNKEKTIEIRIFRGTVNVRHIIRNIEFCDAVCDFCAPCNHSHKDMCDYRKFIEFVKSNGRRWPLLKHWLASMDLIAKKPLPKDDKHFKSAPIEEMVDGRVASQLKVLMAISSHKGPIDEAVKKALDAECVQVKKQYIGDIF